MKETGKNGLICIASSTGGPAVLLQILPKLPADLCVPVIVVQHIWPGFTKGLADNLNEKCILPVSKAKDGEVILPGHIYIAPAEYHLLVKKIPAHHIFHLQKAGEKEVRPRADVLFESLSDSAYPNITAVILTGMGTDATEGIKTLSAKKKVRIYAQNEKSCVVNGMPASIRRAFPDALSLPPEKIADSLCALYRAGV